MIEQLNINPDIAKQPTLVEKPFEYPCKNARYFTRKYGHQIGVIEERAGFLYGGNGLVITDYETIGFYGRWNVDGVFTGDNGNKNPDFDLIMFVWE